MSSLGLLFVLHIFKFELEEVENLEMQKENQKRQKFLQQSLLFEAV